MNCEMCGSAEVAYKANVEGAVMHLCKKCVRYGKALSKVEPALLKKAQAPKQKQPIKLPAKELIELIVPDYAMRIKAKRESLGLKQDEFAKLLSEKESLVHKVETGQFEPSLDTARKLERILKITLIEQQELVSGGTIQPKDSELTIGDFIKVKRR